jgi:hypothetical protein
MGEMFRRDAGGVGAAGRIRVFRLRLRDAPVLLREAFSVGRLQPTGQPFTDGLLFHELVHVEQYRQLGIPRFAELYVRTFLSGGGYDGIPLEINAYARNAPQT